MAKAGKKCHLNMKTVMRVERKHTLLANQIEIVSFVCCGIGKIHGNKITKKLCAVSGVLI